MELKKISWLLRALLALIGLVLVWQLRLELFTLRSFGRMLSDPYNNTALYVRSFVCTVFVALSMAGPLPALAVAWGICRQVGLGRSFYQEKRLRLLARLTAAETVLLAVSDGMMLSFRMDRLGSGPLWGIPALLDGTMVLYLGLALGCAALTAALYALSRSARQAAVLTDENAMTI